jgi:putative acetyltransferase
VEGVTIRHAEVDDADAFHRIMTGPRVVAGTLQLPLQAAEWTRKLLEQKDEGSHVLAAIAQGEVVGNLALVTYPTLWGRRHLGEVHMAVRDDWHGKGVGGLLSWRPRSIWPTTGSTSRGWN